MDFWDVIETRRSVRAFETTPIPRATLKRILHAAGAAPSPANSQPWRFHVAQGAARAELGEVVARATVHLEEYIEVLAPEEYDEAVRWYSSLGDAPVVIAVSMPKATSEFDQMNKLLAVGAACENLMLAAAAEGLGSCNVTFAWWVRDAIAGVCGVGDDRVVVSLIAIGASKERPHPRPGRSADIADWLD